MPWRSAVENPEQAVEDNMVVLPLAAGHVGWQQQLGDSFQASLVSSEQAMCDLGRR